LETPAAAKTRIRHCYNRPQTIRRLSSQKTHSFQRRKTNNNNNKPKLSHPRTQIPTTVTYCKKNTDAHTNPATNKQGKPTKRIQKYQTKPHHPKNKTRQINFTTNTRRRRRTTTTPPPQQQQPSKH
jgi:hypothetical protein